MRYNALQIGGAAVLLQATPLPAPVGYVNDFANVISDDRETSIERIADQVRERSGGEIVVVTLADIGQRDAADVAREIGRQWGVGKAGLPGDRARNTGVIVLLVPKETNSDGRGRCRVETGYGAEGFITDATGGDICRAATPLFQQQQYGAALEVIAFAIAQRFATEFQFSLDTSLAPRVPAQAQRGRRGISPELLIIGFLILLFLFNSMGNRRRRRGCASPVFLPFLMGGGGHHRGGWGGGGGGGFGGGGGGSSW